jgi:hypothetical protein
MEYRWAKNQTDRLPALATDLVVGRCIKAGIAWSKTVIVLQVINEDELVLMVLGRSPT